MQPFIQSSFQHNNIIDYRLYNQYQLNNSTPLSYFPHDNTNYNNSLQYIRSPILQNAFDYIRSSNHHSTSSNNTLNNNTNSSHSNKYASRLNSSNYMNDNYSNAHQNIL